MAFSSTNTETTTVDKIDRKTSITSINTPTTPLTSPTFINNPAFYESSYSTDGLCRDNRGGDNSSVTSSSGGRKSSVREFFGGGAGGVFSKSTPTTPLTELLEIEQKKITRTLKYYKPRQYYYSITCL